MAKTATPSSSSKPTRKPTRKTTRKPAGNISRNPSGVKPGAAVQAVTRQQQKIQAEQDRKDAAPAKKAAIARKKAEKNAVQFGLRDYPAPPLPRQHLTKPGHEADMALQPQFMAPDYKGSGKLAGMSAIITGADSGIGRAVAVLFAREGADVAVCYLSSKKDAAETRRCVEAEGQRCILISGDVKDPAFAPAAVRKAIKAFGKLDILVNNAAFQEHTDSIEELTEEHFDHTLRTNIYGYFHMAKAAVPHLKKGGCIINTGSVTGLEGSPKLLDYSATKGAIHAFTKALAANLMDKGIRVNAVAPGPVWTPLNPADKTPEEIAKFGGATSMKRPAQPEELSPAYVFLASPACASYITGIVLPITGSVGE